MPTQVPATVDVTDIRRCVAMAHVVDVQASADFYTSFGFKIKGEFRTPEGTLNWVHLVSGGGSGGESGGAELMLARASAAIDAPAQAVLFYMYTENLAALRSRLLSAGVHDGGRFQGQPGPNNGCRVAFDIVHPFYMPRGELRVHDPDGYVVLVGQLDPD